MKTFNAMLMLGVFVWGACTLFIDGNLAGIVTGVVIAISALVYIQGPGFDSFWPFARALSAACVTFIGAMFVLKAIARIVF